MKKNKHKEMTISEAGAFYDEHDIFEFGDDKEVADIKFTLQKKKYVGLDAKLFKKIQSKARKLHINEDALIQEWLKEKVG